MADTWKCRPSSWLELREGSIEAFQLDMAALAVLNNHKAEIAEQAKGKFNISYDDGGFNP